MVSDERIAEIRARLDGITDCGWETKGFDESQTVIYGPEFDGGKHELVAVVSVGRHRPHGAANAQFIAHARTDVPDLLDALAAARAEVAALRAGVQDEIHWYESTDGPLHAEWEQGEIGHFDDGTLSFEEAVAAAANEDDYPASSDLTTGALSNDNPVVDRYRRLLDLLAPGPQGSAGSGGEGAVNKADLSAAWNEWRESLTQDDLEGDPRDLIGNAFTRGYQSGAEQAEAREQRLREAIERACRFFGVLAHDADRCYQRQRYAESFDDGIPAHWLLQMAASARSAADQTSAALAATATSAGEGDGT